jgi:exodeoxyribonuclease X
MRNLDDPNLSVGWIDTHFAVVDVESNGQSPPELIELGVVPIDGGHPGHLVSWLVRPIRGIRRRVAEIHGIQESDLMDAPRIEEVRGAILSALEGRYLIAHNAGVDWSILHRAVPGLEPPGVIDTLRLSRALSPGFLSYRLVDLLTVLEIKYERCGYAHRAAHDAYAAAHLFLHLMGSHALGSMSLRELMLVGRLRTADEPRQRELF